MQYAQNLTNLSDKLDAFLSFDPTSQRSVNWIYAFAFWLALLTLGLGGFLVRSSYWREYPPTTWPNVLILYTPLTMEIVWLAAIAAFATGFGRFSFNDSIRWSGTHPLHLKLFQHDLTLGRVPIAITSTLTGAALYILQRYLVEYIGGPVTRSQESGSLSPLMIPAAALTAVFCAPLVEELLYRGILFIQAYGTARKIAAVFISTTLFTWVHVDQYSSKTDEIHWGAILSVLALGLTCSLYRAVTNRVWPAFVIHTTYNLCVAIAYFASVST